MGEIINKEFLQAMKRAGLEGIHLEKDIDYFYIWSKDYEMIDNLECNIIPRKKFSEQSVGKWVKEIQELLKHTKNGHTF